jgi:hypothetical protein
MYAAHQSFHSASCCPVPGLTHDQVMSTIELYGDGVIPRVRELLKAD